MPPAKCTLNTDMSVQIGVAGKNCSLDYQVHIRLGQLATRQEIATPQTTPQTTL
jgi:hypothetical protein